MKDEAINIGLLRGHVAQLTKTSASYPEARRKEIQKRMVAILEVMRKGDPDKGKEER